MRSVRAILSWRLLAILAGLLLVGGLNGCAAPHGRAAPRIQHVGSDATRPAPWWRAAGDPLLARLIDDGLGSDPRLRRKAAALARAETRARTWRYRVDAWFGTLVGVRPENLDDAALRLARARQRKAAAVALDYVTVRRLQAELNLRRAFQKQFGDDSRIAHWRREAGLVSAVDGGLAASLIGVNDDALGATAADLAAARAALARSTGVAGADLDRLLGDAGPIPDLPIGAGAAAPQSQRTAALRSVERDAERTATDARDAYRLGTGDFATVYVAESAVLHVRQAAIAARAARAETAIRLQTDASLAALWQASGREEHAGD